MCTSAGENTVSQCHPKHQLMLLPHNLDYYVFQRAHLASVALAKGHISRSKGHCALWKTSSEVTAG